MAFFPISHDHLVTLCGLLGNIVAFMVYLAPLPIFVKIYKQRSTQGFEAVPYSVALFSAMLTLYYGFSKQDHGFYLITINSIGIGFETAYLAFYIFFAPKSIRVRTIKLLVLFNMGLLGTIVLFTSLFSHGQMREKVVGWFCAIVSVANFASPLSVMRKVIKTKSVEFLPVGLSAFLTLTALTWFVYGFITTDYCIAVPNVLGLLLGFAQMALYLVYRGSTKAQAKLAESKLAGLTEVVVLDDDKKGVEIVNVTDELAAAAEKNKLDNDYYDDHAAAVNGKNDNINDEDDDDDGIKGGDKDLAAAQKKAFSVGGGDSIV